MRYYLRLRIPGGWYFFTVVVSERKPILCTSRATAALREAFLRVKKRYPFKMEAIVVLPDHIHCIWKLPSHDDNFSTRWQLIKRYFSDQLRTGSQANQTSKVWQPRFWEHVLRDEEDWRRHMDYIHYNPVKHGYVKRPSDWPNSSFHRCVKLGFYTENWGSEATFHSQKWLDLNLE